MNTRTAAEALEEVMSLRPFAVTGEQEDYLHACRWWEGKVAEFLIENFHTLRAALAQPQEGEVFNEALRQTWLMVDPLRPPGTPGSYARGHHNGICDALKTARDNFDRLLRATQSNGHSPDASRGDDVRDTAGSLPAKPPQSGESPAQSAPAQEPDGFMVRNADGARSYFESLEEAREYAEWAHGPRPVHRLYAAPQSDEARELLRENYWDLLVGESPAQSAPAQEPVAWTKTDTINDTDGRPIGLDEPRVVFGENPEPDTLEWTPLYAAPQPDEASDLLKDAKHALIWYSSRENEAKANAVAERIRAYLNRAALKEQADATGKPPGPTA